MGSVECHRMVDELRTQDDCRRQYDTHAVDGLQKAVYMAELKINAGNICSSMSDGASGADPHYNYSKPEIKSIFYKQ